VVVVLVDVDEIQLDENGGCRILFLENEEEEEVEEEEDEEEEV
jgi:hypothetical protein